jgi:hypothetical protein
MTDRGEKIISLAEEMLAAREEKPAFFEKTLSRSIPPLRAACFALLLGAAASGAAVHLYDEEHRPANRYERFEIEALIFYATREKALPPDSLRRRLQAYLSLPGLDAMTRADYESARDFLLGCLP